MSKLQNGAVLLTQLEIVKGFNARHESNFGDIKALAQSIKENGLKQPLRVHKTGEKNEDGEFLYALTDGHRRLKALKSIASVLGEDYLVPIIIEPKDYTEEQRNIDLIITNDGIPLGLLEQGTVFARLKEMGHKDSAIGKKCGKSQSHVADCLLLDTASAALKKQIMTGAVSASTVLEMLKTEGHDETEALVDTTVKANNGKKVTAKTVKEVTGKVVGKAKKAEVTASKKAAVEDMKAPKAAPNKEEVKTAAKAAVAATTKTPHDGSLLKLKEINELLNKMVGMDTTKTKRDHSFKLMDMIIAVLEGRAKATSLEDMFFKPVEAASAQEVPAKTAKVPVKKPSKG
jgi:ParB/RepB/Spo0J family partition protein